MATTEAPPLAVDEVLVGLKTEFAEYRTKVLELTTLREARRVYQEVALFHHRVGPVYESLRTASYRLFEFIPAYMHLHTQRIYPDDKRPKHEVIAQRWFLGTWRDFDLYSYTGGTTDSRLEYRNSKKTGLLRIYGSAMHEDRYISERDLAEHPWARVGWELLQRRLDYALAMPAELRLKVPNVQT